MFDQLSVYFRARNALSGILPRIMRAIGLALLFGAAATVAQAETVRLGTRGGVDEQIWEVVTKVARQRGLDVKVVVITGTASPNEALDNGDLDANSFQYAPYMEEQNRRRGYKLVSVGETYVSPIALYSSRHKSVADIADGAKIGIPNDPSNQTRVLLFLADLGLLKLKSGIDPRKGDLVTVADIQDNPRKFDLVEASYVLLARSLQDLDAAVISNNFASEAGLYATRDGIAIEKREGNPYTNIIAVRAENRDAPWVRGLVEAYQSDEVRAFIRNSFHGSVIPAF